MPDGPTPKAPDYDDDFYAWTQHQAVVLREIPLTVDREPVLEKIEDLAKNERDAVRSQLHPIIEIFFGAAVFTATTPRPGSMASINDARRIHGDKLGGALRRDIEARLPALWEALRYQAEWGTQEDGDAAAAPLFPENRPCSFDRILQRRWYPEPLETP